MPDRQPLRLDGGQAIAAFFTSAERYGRWVVPASVTCSAVFGEAVLDLREALLQDRHVVLNVYALFGRIRLIVPAGVEVVMNGTGVHRPAARRDDERAAGRRRRPGGRGARVRGRERSPGAHPAAAAALAAAVAAGAADVTCSSRS